MMAKLLSLVLLVALGVSLVKGDTCTCIKIYKPVCGSDMETYANKCEFECAQRVKTDLRILHDGPCAAQIQRDLPKCPCSREIFYVCGSDGVSYTNPCELKCAQKTKQDLVQVREGKCVEDKLLTS